MIRFAVDELSTVDDEKRAGTDPAKVLAVELARVGEEDGARRHVEAHGERLGGEERLDQALGEQNLHRLLQNRQQTCRVQPHGFSLPPRFGTAHVQRQTVFLKRTCIVFLHETSRFRKISWREKGSRRATKAPPP